MDVEHIIPYSDKDGDKTTQVRNMFDNIAPAYDFMNRAMTMGVDKLWRRKAISSVASQQPKRILDLATGTADLAIGMAKRISQAHITGADLSPQMLQVGLNKVKREGLENRISLQVADGTHLPFDNETFDCVTIAYGIRNFQDIVGGYREMYRVLRPGGVLMVLELATPANPIALTLYKFYTKAIIPLLGRLVSHDKSAYSYLPQSIAAVPQRNNMLELMQSVGFTSTTYKSLTFGTCIIYTAEK